MSGKTKKIPIDEFGEGNCCPKCGSMLLSDFIQYPILVEVDHSTRKEIFRDAYGKRKRRPSKNDIWVKYDSRGEFICYTIHCRKCGWDSEVFIP